MRHQRGGLYQRLKIIWCGDRISSRCTDGAGRHGILAGSSGRRNFVAIWLCASDGRTRMTYCGGSMCVLVVTQRLRTLCAGRVRPRTNVREAAVEVVIAASRIGAGNCCSGAGWSAFSSVFLIASRLVAVQFGAHPIGGMAIGFCTVECLRAAESVLRAVNVGIVRERIVVADGGFIAVGLVARRREKTCSVVGASHGLCRQNRCRRRRRHWSGRR
jgi:hypothetical protein